MAQLVAPGVSVTVTDQSFFIPATAPLIPLLFIATADEKTQLDGVTPAAGTYENNVIRTVTSITISEQLYGLPIFLTDVNGNPLNGDCRNEYGLFALNQSLNNAGINIAYVIRAFVNTDDTRNQILALYGEHITEASQLLAALAQSVIDNFNTANGFFPGSPGYKQTLTESEFLANAHTACVEDVYSSYSFRTTTADFEDDHTATPLLVFPNGYNQPPAVQGYLGLTGIADQWVTLGLGSLVATEWTPAEAAQTLVSAAAQFQFTREFLNDTSLGSDDAARRNAIVAALRASIVSNQQIRSDNYLWNVVVCPGFPEVVTELMALIASIRNEAMCIGDTPFDLDPEDVVSTWADNVSSNRVHNNRLAYYYPHGIAANLDGATCFVAASGFALETWAISDSEGQIWFAPAGTTRGVIPDAEDLGYVVGVLGTATTFVPVALSDGQQANLYKYFTNINPMVNMANRGKLLFGQKTSQGVASSEDRINVSRLVAYIARQLRINLVPFLFEPNDQTTRNQVKTATDAFLQVIMANRGLIDFATICDSSNNPPGVVQQNQLFIDVALKPTLDVEFIYVPIRVVSQGAVIH
jgi:hypothetical protein